MTRNKWSKLCQRYHSQVTSMKIYRICSNKIKYNSIWNQIFCTAILDMDFCIYFFTFILKKLFQAQTSWCFVEEVSHQIRLLWIHTLSYTSSNPRKDFFWTAFLAAIQRWCHLPSTVSWAESMYFQVNLTSFVLTPKKHHIHPPKYNSSTLINGVFKTILCYWCSGGVSCWTSGGV